MSTYIRGACLECQAPVADARYAYCPDCIAGHQSAWKEEHTRKPGDMRSGWLIGDECRVKLHGVEYKARIIDMSDVSRRENGYDLVALELTKTVKGFDGKPITQTWMHPEPVQSYKLRKAY